MANDILAKATSASLADLPDSAFLLVLPGGTLDADKKTTPRDLRHFPVYDADGQLDLPLLTSALAAIPKAELADADKQALLARARKLLADAQKTTHKRAAGLPAWALDYVAHVDRHEALGLTGADVAKAWAGDAMIGRRTVDLMKSLTMKSSDRVSKRITIAIDKVLRLKVAVHNTAQPAPKFRAKASMLKAAYQRGVAAFGKSKRPCVKSAPQWGMTRVAAVLSYCKTGALPHASYTADLDLLPKTVTRKDDLAEGGELAADTAPLRRTTFAGLPIVIDRPKGFVQRKLDDAGKVLWERTYTTDYGYVPATLGGDDEELDVYLLPNEEADTAFWVVQVDDAGEFDEYKVILGAEDEDEARKVFTDHTPEKYLGRMFETPISVIHALLGLEPGDMLKAIDPGFYFVASDDGAEVMTAHPWTTLALAGKAGDEEDDAEAPPTRAMSLTMAAHAAMAATLAAVKSVLPAGVMKVVTPMSKGAAQAVAEDGSVLLLSAPDPFLADIDSMVAVAEKAKAALVELPETSKNVASLAQLGGVFQLADVPGRVFVATYPVPRSAAVQPIDAESMTWAEVDIDALKASLEKEVLEDPDEEADVEKDQRRADDGKFAGGGGGGGHGGSHPAGGAGGHSGDKAFGAKGNTDHENKMAWGKIKAKETGKPVHVIPDKKGGEPKLAYKAPKKGPFSTIHPDGSTTHQKAVETEKAEALPPNDLVRLAMDHAVEAFGEQGNDGLFNAAGLGLALMDLAGLKGVVDGRLVRVILAGRPDVQLAPDGAHYQRIAGAATGVAKAGTLLQIGKAATATEPAEERYTLGIVLVPDEPDLQGDTYDAPTVRRAAHIFAAKYQNTGLQHSVKPADIQAFQDENPALANGKIEIVETYVTPVDMVIGGQTVKAGTWLMGHHWIDDGLWADVLADKYTGLSMGGFARRIALQGTAANTNAAAAA